jgi:heme-degrading monooxygenase HmoA
MHARVTQFSVQPGKLDDFVHALEAARPLMHERKGFQALLVLRVEGSNPPDVRVMTFWDSQQALQESESSVQFYAALARAMTFSQGFPLIREEEVMVSDFPRATAAGA